jgi:hypothetical protein
MINDPIVEEVRRVRKQIERECGGPEGVFRHYLLLSKRRESTEASKKAKRRPVRAAA